MANKISVTQLPEAITDVAANHSVSVVSLITEASWVVQLVMLMLFLASVVSWFIIFSKWMTLKREKRLSDQFEKDFWAGGSMEQLYNSWGARRKDTAGMSDIFVAGYREYLRLMQTGYVNSKDIIDAVNRAMRVELSREIDHLESQIPFLATVGSTSPYIGLFGTVWGIMNSFISLSQSTQQATITSVAPGIAEALIATAMGLFAAIPAVIAYNRFSHQVERLVGRYEIFTEEFLSIINRQLVSEKD
ncbi:MAG: protein TolQ [Arenicella sp.]